MAGPARIIAMLNQKGGVGKTTTTVNLGAALALPRARGPSRKVCLIDMDPQAHLSLHLGIEAGPSGALDAGRPPHPGAGGRSVYDLLVDPECPAGETVVAAGENLDVIPAEMDLAAAETELAAVPGRQRILREKFQPLIDRYDIVFIDCPPSLGLLTLNALALAREVLVPMQAHFLALQGVSRLLETVGRVCRSVNPDLRVTGIILCMHEQQTTLAREVVADLEAFFEQARSRHGRSAAAVPWRDCRVLRPAIRRNVKLAEAPSFGRSIFDYEPSCPGAQDYAALAESLIASAAASDEPGADEPVEIVLRQPGAESRLPSSEI